MKPMRISGWLSCAFVAAKRTSQCKVISRITADRLAVDAARSGFGEAQQPDDVVAANRPAACPRPSGP